MYEREVMPYYGGLVSFFRAPGIEVEDVTEGLAVVAGVPIDNGIPQGRVGARFGPRAIREASLGGRGMFESAIDNTRIHVDTGEALRMKDDLKLADLGDFNIYPTDLMRTTDSVIQGMSEVVKRGGFPIVLGGDHYVSYPSFTGFAKGMQERQHNVRLGYVHFDSHTDFRDETGSIGGRYTHGTMVRRISENPAIDFKNIVWVGLNGYGMNTDQYELKKEHNLRMLTSRNILQRGIEEIVREAMEAASDGVDAVYVSVDIDVVDASESPGTGAPEFEGIQAKEFLQAMSIINEYDTLRAFDLCEVAPEWDHSGRTVMLASRGITNVLAPRLFDKLDLG
jgi:agmatinase